MTTEPSLDLSSIFQRDTFDADSYEALKELAFSGTESVNRFRTLVSDLERQAQTGDATTGQAALKLGMCYLLMGDAGKAAHWLEQANDVEEKARYLGQAYRELGRHGEAVQQFERAGQLSSDRLYYDCQRAESHILLGEMDKALEILNQHSADGESSGAWHYTRGRYWDAIGEWERAIDEFECVLRPNGRHTQAMFHLAYLLHLHGSDERAKQMYQALAGKPVVHADALMNLALIYEDESNFEEAARCLERVVAVNPQNERAQLFKKDVVSAEHMYIDEQQVMDAEKRSAVLDIPVSDFELSVRSRNCLKKMNINTLGDLLRTTESELLSYKNFGETSLKEIKIMLDQKGLVLGQLATDSTLSPLSLIPMESVSEKRVDPEVYSKPVSILELSVRSRKCLQQHGIHTLGDLTGYSEEELNTSQNFGQTSLDEIKDSLARFDLSLKSS
ncbi:MAG: DNA-directed RNA polymerase subunit alpha C-terminal domain-containing protein [Phycisphaerae bacterium]